MVASLARRLTGRLSQHEQAIETATGALACARQLGLPELEAHALNTLGIALVATGDLDGIAQLEESVRIALDHAGPVEIARIYNNLIAGYVRSGRLKEATTIAETLLDFQQRVGMPSQTQEIFVAMHEFTLGRWNDALTRIDSARRTRRASTHLPYGAHGAIAQMLLARDDLPGAVAECERALDLFRARGRDPDSRLGLQSFLALRGLIALAQDERAVADDLADELLAMDVDARSTYPMSMFLIALLLSDLGRKDRAAFMDAVGERPQPWVRVAIAISEGRFGEAVDRLADMGAQTFEAAVRLRVRGAAGLVGPACGSGCSVGAGARVLPIGRGDALYPRGRDAPRSDRLAGEVVEQHAQQAVEALRRRDAEPLAGSVRADDLGAERDHLDAWELVVRSLRTRARRGRPRASA